MKQQAIEWDAAEYSRMSGLQKAMAQEVLALLELEGTEQVLDVGCGDGKITALIADRVPDGSVTGVDPSHDMIAFAAQHFAGDRLPNLRFEHADARTLPFKEQFDLVVSFNALHWVPNQDAALASLRTAMKPAATAQLRLVTAGQKQSLESVVEDTRKSSRWEKFYCDFDDPYLRLASEQYATMAKQNGLNVTFVHSELKTWDFETRTAFFDFCSVGLAAWTKRLPQAERPAFLNDVLDRYCGLVGAETLFNFYQSDFTLSASWL